MKYVSDILPTFSRKCLRSSPSQDTTKSTSLSEVHGMWYVLHAQKCVQQMWELIDTLFVTLSCFPALWSCCTTGPSHTAPSSAKAAWLAWTWTSLFARAFIFTTAFFQLLNGLITHTPLVCWILQTLHKATWLCSSYSSQGECFPTLCSISRC